MASLVIMSTSYRPDLELFARLHRSVLRHVPAGVVHQVVVPRDDVAVFEQVGRNLGSDRLVVCVESDFLPSTFLRTDRFAAAVSRVGFLPAKAHIKAINRERPWPPVRGWILQQVIKLEAAQRLAADVVAVIDSDVVLIAPVTAATFVEDGVVRTYGCPGAVDDSLTRHLKWAQVAHRLLGLELTPPPYPDYIAGLITWDPVVVAQCLERVESVQGVSWQTAVAREVHFSEFTLYGTYVKALGTAEQQAFVRDDTLCHSYWDTAPMDMTSADRFLEGIRPSDVAVHVQSASDTPGAVRDHIFDSLEQR